LAAGYAREDRLAMALTAYREIQTNPDVRVLPARPMRAAYRAVFDEAWSIYPDSMRSDCVDACVERLDDHRMDMFVALIDKQPAGVCGLFQVGDIGRIVDVYACRAFRRKNAVFRCASSARTCQRPTTRADHCWLTWVSSKVAG